jgi:hypothetical protein
LSNQRQRQLAEVVVKSLLRAQATLETLTSRTGNFIAGLSLGLLDNRALGRLTIAAYDQRGTYAFSSISDWEESWFERDLPAPPVRILVGAAGSGREVNYLEEVGYHVVAFEPAINFVQNANRAGLLRQPMHVGSYQDLLDNSSDLSRSLALEPPFDAVLLGWGSLTHVPGQPTRTELLRRLRRLCPHGPLLASFWLKEGAAQPTRPKTRKMGERLAAMLGGNAQHAEMDVVSGRTGYAHWFTEAELLELARDSGYFLKTGTATIDSTTYPHVTLWPVQE